MFKRHIWTRFRKIRRAWCSIHGAQITRESFLSTKCRRGTKLEAMQSGTHRHLRLASLRHEVGRGECPRSVSQSHDYTATSRSFIILAMRGGGRRDLSLRGKIAKPLFEEVGWGGSVAASGLPPKDQDTRESPGSARISLPRHRLHKFRGGALPTP